MVSLNIVIFSTIFQLAYLIFSVALLSSEIKQRDKIIEKLSRKL